MVTPKLPPHSEEAERSLLGLMLLQKDAVLVAMDSLTADDFYSGQHQIIFSAMSRLYRDGYAIDYVTLLDKLNATGEIEKVGVSYLTELTAMMSFSENASQYCRIISEKSTLRKLITGLGSVITQCYDQSDDTQNIMEAAERIIYNLSLNTANNDLTQLKDIIRPLVDKVGDLYERNEMFTGVPTGFRELDDLTNGLQPGDLILLAARPSMGKTAFGINIAQNAAFRNGKIVAVFSLEMSSEQLATRIMSSEKMFDTKMMNSPSSISSVYGKILSLNQEVSEQDTQLYIDDTSAITIGEMRSKLRKLKARRGLDLVVIDYLQLMSTNLKTENRQQEITLISRELKGLAKELECPIVTLSQLSRGPESRTNKRPIMSDLRESGAIEQDADIVMMLYRESYYNPDYPTKETELIIAKNRNGEVKTIKLDFRPEYTLFSDYTGTYDNFEE